MLDKMRTSDILGSAFFIYMVGQNDCSKCCGVEPTLRVRPLFRANALIRYVQYECKTCGRKGGLAQDEEEARNFWENP